MPIAATATALAVWVAVPGRPPISTPPPLTSAPASGVAPVAPVSPATVPPVEAPQAAANDGRRELQAETPARNAPAQEGRADADKDRQNAQAAGSPLEKTDRLVPPPSAAPDAAAARSFDAVAPKALQETITISGAAPLPAPRPAVAGAVPATTSSNAEMATLRALSDATAVPRFSRRTRTPDGARTSKAVGVQHDGRPRVVAGGRRDARSFGAHCTRARRRRGSGA